MRGEAEIQHLLDLGILPYLIELYMYGAVGFQSALAELFYGLLSIEDEQLERLQVLVNQLIRRVEDGEILSSQEAGLLAKLVVKFPAIFDEVIDGMHAFHLCVFSHLLFPLLALVNLMRMINIAFMKLYS